MENSNILIKGIKIIDSFFDKISKLCCVISGFLLVGVTLIIFAGVFNRAFLDFTWLFVEEYSALALVPISYVAMGYTLRWNQHLKMDLVVRRVPYKVKQILGIFAAVFSMICIVYMTVAAVDWLTYTFERSVTSSGALRTPLWPVSTFMFVGVALFAIDMALLIIHRIIQVIYGKSPLKFLDDEEEISFGEGV